MTGERLMNCRQADILTCDAENLVDLKEVSICADLPLPQRTEQYWKAGTVIEACRVAGTVKHERRSPE